MNNARLGDLLALVESLPYLYQDRHTRGEERDNVCPFCGEAYGRKDKIMLNHFSDCPLLMAGTIARQLRDDSGEVTP